MNLFVVLVLSIISVLSLLVGTLIVFSTQNSKKVMAFSVSLGFVVLIMLGILHLIPDALEFFSSSFSNGKSYLMLAFFTALGFVVLLVFDMFGGHHHSHEEDHRDNHFHHISIITCIFLVIHNFIEGMTLYSSVLLSYEAAVILTLGIALHNIPLGFTLSSTFEKVFSKTKTLLFIVLIGISYLFGALVAYKFNEVFMNPVILGIALTFTFGMVLYIAVFEFLPLIRENGERRVKLFGFVLGVVLMILTLFL